LRRGVVHNYGLSDESGILLVAGYVDYTRRSMQHVPIPNFTSNKYKNQFSLMKYASDLIS
jgi:hypothetical protein